ncbi:MAG: 2-dehydropantoate 2-reductase N-terminal domain-containing protein [Candidatus Pelagibacter sp.]|jgi:glycerol-3-phosphate dehydrogenase (NAD(P)+)|tara:strand:- start:1134 stop:2093 length:960 start_codon:yes stop_codon:yes gene_type:complete
MKKILIIGAGAMGAAFAFPCLDNNHKVTLSEPYDLKLIKKLSFKKKFHPVLKLNLPKKLTIKKFSKEILNLKWDLIVVAVSSSGIDLVRKNLKNVKNKCPLLVLTKGLKYDKNSKKIITMSEQLNLGNKFIVSSLKGPCLANELARKIKSSTVIANKNLKVAKSIGKLISTNYYQVEFSKDIRGVEISSAIKNIYSMIIGSGEGLNTSSSMFRKSISEMIYLIKYFKGKEETIYGLAGIGDLYVSAMGGRNSKMGKYLGKGFTFKYAKKKFMPNDTIEGAQLASEIAPFILKKINSKKIPLMIDLLKSITKNKTLNIRW